MKTRITNIPEGSKIFFGDPCYALPRPEYQSAVIDNPDMTNREQPEGIAGRDEDGNVITVFCDTKYGDGEYASRDGKYFGVDAGILGVSLTQAVKYDVETLNELGLVIDIPEGTASIDILAEREMDYQQGDVVLAAIFFDAEGKRISSTDTVIYTAADDEDESEDDWASEDEYDYEDSEDGE